ncbi:MAG TPA: fibronectin type III domain-containing protein [Vicinamibacteria bacterium]|nr:fibronectin type III domain-containing protein [Vicinamibacteria bacterium]
MGLAAACGKRGDPLPPLPRAPQAVTGLKLAQRGDSLEITFVAPRATTGGVRLGVLDVETLRADVPGDLRRVGRRARRRVAPGETLVETYPLPPAGTTVRLAALALDGRHVSVLSPAVSLNVAPAPPAPYGLEARLEGRTVHLGWQGTIPTPPPTPPPSPSPSPSPGASPAMATASPPGPSAAVVPPTASPSAPPSPPATTPSGLASPAPAGAAAAPLASPSPSPVPSPTPRPPTRGFLVYRRSDPAGAFGAPLNPVPLEVTTFEDRAVALDQRWCYVVGTVVSTAPVVESGRSNEACLSVKDIVAPESPVGVAAVGGSDGVEVSWSPSTEADLAAYRVYRRPADGGEPQRLAEVKPPQTSWRDATAASGSRYVYTVTAVDQAGNESSPSAVAPGGRP